MTLSIVYKHSKIIEVFLVIILSFSKNFGQSNIKGIITERTGSPLGYANILLLQAIDSSFIKGEIAGVDGKYQFQNIPEGNYLCEFSMIGYPNKYSQIFKISTTLTTIDLDTMIMEESIMLDGVEIIAKRAFLEQKIDRTVVNVSNSNTNAGGNALEVLTRSPGVQVNRLTKTISLVGKEGVVIMINGKISRMPSDAVVQMLEGMNADNIDRIELIHTPPSNFDAEGNAGIINIILILIYNIYYIKLGANSAPKLTIRGHIFAYESKHRIMWVKINPL